jgi:phage baseplate assembly protein W
VRDLQIAGGDLILAGGELGLVDGTAYIRQRIATALAEPYGNDPFQPTWGSTLASFLGGPIVPGTDALVASEVSRVLAQLIAAQRAMITGWSLTGSKSQLLADDTIAAVNSVNAYIGVDPEMIVVTLSLTTQGGQRLALSRTVSLVT